MGPKRQIQNNRCKKAGPKRRVKKDWSKKKEWSKYIQIGPIWSKIKQKSIQMGPSYPGLLVYFLDIFFFTTLFPKTLNLYLFKRTGTLHFYVTFSIKYQFSVYDAFFSLYVTQILKPVSLKIASMWFCFSFTHRFPNLLGI